MNVYLVKFLFSKIFTSPQSPPCEGGETRVVVLVADMLRYEFYTLI